jgi:hypothetical protein
LLTIANYLPVGGLLTWTLYPRLQTKVLKIKLLTADRFGQTFKLTRKNIGNGWSFTSFVRRLAGMTSLKYILPALSFQGHKVLYSPQLDKRISDEQTARHFADRGPGRGQ